MFPESFSGVRSIIFMCKWNMNIDRAHWASWRCHNLLAISIDIWSHQLLIVNWNDSKKSRWIALEIITIAMWNDINQLMNGRQLFFSLTLRYLSIFKCLIHHILMLMNLEWAIKSMLTFKHWMMLMAMLDGRWCFSMKMKW